MYNNKLQMATAPYNFIPLPENTLYHPIAENFDIIEWKQKDKKTIQKNFSDYVEQNGKYTGYIELKLTTLTPCFIGGKEKNDTKEFFSTEENGKPIIPGSSVRGMMRNIFKIITAGVWRPNEDFDNKHLYFRKIMSTTNDKTEDTLSKHYKFLLDKENGGTKPGFLIKIKGTGEFFICPADIINKEVVDAKRKRDKGDIDYYSGKESYAIATTGEINNKQHKFHIGKGDFRKKARIPMNKDLNIIENYEEDNNRRGLNLIKTAEKKCKGGKASGFTKEKDIDLVAPCFYVEKDGFIQSFGHGSCYRVPYLNAISEHIPKQLLAGKVPVDFTDVVFGNKEYFAGRVFFENLIPITEIKKEPSEYSKPLMNPNPTSYQLYLEQNDDFVGKNHWDTPNIKIKGYKHYWHRFEEKSNFWMNNNSNKPIRGTKKIHPIKKGSEFFGKIRFENLSQEELGALCICVELSNKNTKTAYKIGMGKSIGMGSILIDSELYIENKNERYKTLFKENNEGWNYKYTKEKTQNFKTSFETYRNNHLSEKDKIAFEKVLNSLAAFVDYNNKNIPEWIEKTNMMGNGDKRFTKRIALLDTIKFKKEPLK